MKIWYVLRWACRALSAELHKLNGMLLTDDFYLTAEPVRLWIEVNPETVSLDCNNVQKTPLSIRFWSGEGSIKTALAAYLTLKVESVVGNSVTTLYTYTSPGAVSSYGYTIPSNSYPTANRISIHSYEDAARTKEIGSKQINIVVDNPTPFPRSEAWSTGLTYKNGEYLLQEDVIYMWSSRVPGNTSVSPKADLSSATPSGKWRAYQNWPLLATNIALIKFGLIGSAVFKDEFMYSQQGKTAAGVDTIDYRKFGTDDFIPNLLFNFRTGRQDSNLCFLRASLYTPFNLLLPNANNAVYADFSTGFNLDIGRLVSSPTVECILYLPKAVSYSGAVCYLYNSCGAYTRSGAPCTVKISNSGQFLNLYSSVGTNANAIKIGASKMLRLRAVESRDMDGTAGTIYWYIENPEDCTVAGYAPH